MIKSYLKGPLVYLYRVSNNGLTGWRPTVNQIQAFSDQGCSDAILAAYVDESGHNNGFGDGRAAFDDKYGTQWRPQCTPCTKGEAWVTFSTNSEAKCISATNLGKATNLGLTGGKYWNNGIKVELQNPDGSWRVVMESQGGNSAAQGI